MYSPHISMCISYLYNVDRLLILLFRLTLNIFLLMVLVVNHDITMPMAIRTTCILLVMMKIYENLWTYPSSC